MGDQTAEDFDQGGKMHQRPKLFDRIIGHDPALVEDENARADFLGDLEDV